MTENSGVKFFNRKVTQCDPLESLFHIFWRNMKGFCKGFNKMRVVLEANRITDFGN